jgi:hypothetical protein
MNTERILKTFFLFERYNRGVEEYQSEIFLVGLVREVNPNPTRNPYPISVNINFQKPTDTSLESPWCVDFKYILGLTIQASYNALESEMYPD